MNKDNEYRENAAECERMACLTRDKTNKRTWLDMAQHWRSLISVPASSARRGGPTGPSCAKLRISSDPPAFKFPVKPRALAMTSAGVEKRWRFLVP